jgi:hypothetical protein
VFSENLKKYRGGRNIILLNNIDFPIFEALKIWKKLGKILTMIQNTGISWEYTEREREKRGRYRKMQRDSCKI